MNAQSKIEPLTRPLVYEKIAAVQGALAVHGIGKDRTAKAGNSSYKFRGIDDVYNALAPLLAEHGLTILPRMLSREVVERKSSSGNALFYVTVEAEFDFVAADDGSSHTVRTFGEAMDSGDKATNKAMSAAYKYAAFMAFAIPTEGDNDSENETHEVAATGMPDAEWAKLVQLIEATKADRGWLIKHYGVQNLRHLNQDQYADAIANLNNRLADAAKKETNKAAAGFGEVLADEIPY